MNLLVILVCAFLIVLTLIFSCMADEENWWAGLLSVALIGLFAFTMSRWGEIMTMLNVTSILYAAGTFAAYSVVGIVWAVFKWFLFTRDLSIKLKVWLETNMTSTDMDTLTPAAKIKRIGEYRKSFPEHVEYVDTTDKFTVTASRHKPRITKWIALWPLNVVYTLVEDFLLRLWENLYEFFSGVFQRISDRMFSGINQ